MGRCVAIISSGKYSTCLFMITAGVRSWSVTKSWVNILTQKIRTLGSQVAGTLYWLEDFWGH